MSNEELMKEILGLCRQYVSLSGPERTAILRLWSKNSYYQALKWALMYKHSDETGLRTAAAKRAMEKAETVEDLIQVYPLLEGSIQQKKVLQKLVEALENASYEQILQICENSNKELRSLGESLALVVTE